jgi:polyisoprenyl-phosphate glycosyltransferase
LNTIEVSIVIPFYNESEGIEFLFENLIAFSQTNKLLFEVILIDDGSVDDSNKRILSYKNLPFKCKLISLSKNFGSHAAIRAGFLHSSGEYSVYFPTDMQISLETIFKIYECAKLNSNHVVVGVRDSNEVTGLEKWFSDFYSFLMQKFVVRAFPKQGMETLLISKKVYELLNKNIEANSSFALQILSYGFKTEFLNIEKKNRTQGKSKWTIGKKIKLFIDSFVAFSYAPIRLVSFIGILFFVFGLVWTTYIISRKLIYDDVASGWPALTSILLLGFGITNIGLGIIAEYLWRTLDASRKRPVYIIDETIQLDNNEK